MPRFSEPQEYRSHGKIIGYRVQWSTPDKKRHGKVFRFKAFDGDKQKAHAAARAELARMIGESQAYRDGTKTFIADDGMTLGMFYKEVWLTGPNKKKRQPQNDWSIWKVHLKDTFENTPLKALVDAVLVRRYQSKIMARLKPATAQNVMSLLMAMLNHACYEGYMHAAPKVKRIKKDKRGFNILKTDAEITAFLSMARAQSLEHFAVYAVAVFTGMRAGEIVALRRRDVDLDAKRIMVRFSHENATKSGEPRPVPVLVELAPVLKEWLEVSKDKPNPKDLVFPSPDGQMYRNDTAFFKKWYRAALIAAKVETKETEKANRMRFHDLRHTFASMFLSHGGSLQEVKEILGHSSLQVTEMYAHFVPNSFKGASGKFSLPTKPEPSIEPPKKRPKKPKQLLRLVK